ncbi:type II secretion system protein [Planctomycetota bacterium]
MKRKKRGLTIIEMLVVLGIIATIAGLLIPATQSVRRYAKNTKQRVQFTNISVALEAWKNDSELGQYPSSSVRRLPELSGATNLATAIMGLDMRGFHPATRLDSDNINDVIGYYNNPQQTILPDDNIDARREHYLDMTVARPFRMWNDAAGNQPGLFDNVGTLLPYSYALCDVFDFKSRLMPIMDAQGNILSSKTVKIGSPILYFRANINGTRLFPQSGSDTYDDRAIYQYADNMEIVTVKHSDMGQTVFPEDTYRSDNHNLFYQSIRNPTAPNWNENGIVQGQPYRRDTYLLISAGADGIYGTEDDIQNFGN